MFFTDYSMRPGALGQALEARGFESVWAPEHSHIPSSRLSQPASGGELGKQYYDVMDPFVTLTAAAMATRTLKIATGVCLVIQRDTIQTAKLVASLDQVSGGRFLFGIGGGWNREEMADHGAEFKTRFKKMREQIEAMRAIWTQSEPEYHGDIVDFPKMRTWPKPLQQPHPPVWIGGLSDAALRRAARFAAVWQPTPTSLADLIERRASLRAACERTGRQEPPATRMSFRVEFSAITGNVPPGGAARPVGHGAPAEIAGDLSRYREEAGVDAFQINFQGLHSLDQLLTSMGCFMQEVKPQVS
jgi:probable F420-dependent oxidoreductase